MNNIGKKIKEPRKSKGKTLRELAAKISVSYTIISEWECEKIEPRARNTLSLPK